MSSASLRVLLVDDEQLARERLRRMLAAYDRLEIVDEAEDGEQAIEKILDLRPELVFLDIQMPGCSGLEVAASLPSPRPKIIFCTAYDEYAVDAFELHAVDYLLKPVKQSELFDAIVMAMGISVVEDEDATVAGGKQPTWARSLRILLAEDSLVNQKLAVGLLERQGHSITVANNGKEAVALAGLQDFDVILMDVQMPEMDGLEATGMIRGKEKLTASRGS